MSFLASRPCSAAVGVDAGRVAGRDLRRGVHPGSPGVQGSDHGGSPFGVPPAAAARLEVRRASHRSPSFRAGGRTVGPGRPVWWSAVGVDGAAAARRDLRRALHGCPSRVWVVDPRGCAGYAPARGAPSGRVKPFGSAPNPLSARIPLFVFIVRLPPRVIVDGGLSSSISRRSGRSRGRRPRRFRCTSSSSVSVLECGPARPARVTLAASER